MSALGLFFGWPYGGVWSNLVASAICSGVVWWRLHRQAVRHHVEHLAVIARNHYDLIELAGRQHAERMEQAGRHHQEQLDRADAHAEAVKHAVALAARPPGGGM